MSLISKHVRPQKCYEVLEGYVNRKAIMKIKCRLDFDDNIGQREQDWVIVCGELTLNVECN
jgi:hypothetical protein